MHRQKSFSMVRFGVRSAAIILMLCLACFITPLSAAEPIEVVELDPVTVSNVDIQQQSISFEADQVGVPVLVRVSYFPTWKVDGADGPYRVAPNFMVVIPTENQVTLSYSKTPLDWFFYSLKLVGIALCFYWRRKGDVVYPGDRPDWRAGSTPEPEPESEPEPELGPAATPASDELVEVAPGGAPPAAVDDGR